MEVPLLQCIPQAQQTWDEKHMCWDTIVLHHSNKWKMLHNAKPLTWNVHCFSRSTVQLCMWWKPTFSMWLEVIKTNHNRESLDIWFSIHNNLTSFDSKCNGVMFSCYSTVAVVLLIYPCSKCRHLLHLVWISHFVCFFSCTGVLFTVFSIARWSSCMVLCVAMWIGRGDFSWNSICLYRWHDKT